MRINVDDHKLMYHPERVAEWLKEGDCYPVYVEFGLTNKCNHRCGFCALDWMKHGGADIDKSVMKRTLKEMAECGVKSTMFAGEGEPLIHKNACDFVHYASEQGIEVAITSNGVLFDENKARECLPYLSWIRFSIDAGTRETYAKLHGTKPEDFDKVIRNIRSASEIKKNDKLKCVIGTQALLLPENAGELEKFVETIKWTGADNVQIKPYSQHPSSHNRQSIHYPDYADLKSRVEKFENPRFQVIFREQTMQRLEEKFPYPYCFGSSFFALVDARGNVMPCNLFYNNPDFIYGNLNEESFSEIWKGEKRRKVREKLAVTDRCREVCRLDPCNRYLHRLKNLNSHDKFI